MGALVKLLRIILAELREILRVLRLIEANTKPPPPEPTSVRWHIGSPKEEV